MALPENFGKLPRNVQVSLAQTKAYFLQHHVSILMENGGIPFPIVIGGVEHVIDQTYVQKELEQLNLFGFDLYGNALPLDPSEAVRDAEEILARGRQGHQPPSLP